MLDGAEAKSSRAEGGGGNGGGRVRRAHMGAGILRESGGDAEERGLLAGTRDGGDGDVDGEGELVTPVNEDGDLGSL